MPLRLMYIDSDFLLVLAIGVKVDGSQSVWCSIVAKRHIYIAYYPYLDLGIRLPALVILALDTIYKGLRIDESYLI